MFIESKVKKNLSIQISFTDFYQFSENFLLSTFTNLYINLNKFEPKLTAIFQKFAAINYKNKLLLTNLLTTGVNFKNLTAVNFAAVKPSKYFAQYLNIHNVPKISMI